MKRGLSFFEGMPHPAIIAHRGASVEAPENTLAAFRLAVDLGAHAIELDAKLSADGEIVVMHDDTVDRTTNGHGRVKDIRLNDLKKLDAGVNHDGNFHGEQIPTLAEVFDAVDGQTMINVELTNYSSPFDDLPLRVVELIPQYHIEERILFSSFNPIALYRAGRAFPEISRALLISRGSAALWMRGWMLIKGLGCQAVHAALGDINPDFVRQMHNNNLRVQVYTVNGRVDLKRMIEADVDGIFTDDVRLAKEITSAGGEI